MNRQPCLSSENPRLCVFDKSIVWYRAVLILTTVLTRSSDTHGSSVAVYMSAQHLRTIININKPEDPETVDGPSIRVSQFTATSEKW